jgi:hypothetical protein
MPTRILRDWTDSESVNSLSDGAEKFFVRLIMKADDFGRFHGTAKMLRPTLYPLQLDRVREADLDRWMAECQKASLVRLYEAQGKRVVEIVKFGQRTRAEHSKFPSCPSDAGQVTVTCQTPAHVVGDGDVVEGGDDAHTPTLEEFRGYAQGLCIPPDVVEACYHYYAAAGFCRGQTRLTNYRSLLMAWWAKEQSNPKKQQAARPRMAI